jgi:hypothetical protein
MRLSRLWSSIPLAMLTLVVSASTPTPAVSPAPKPHIEVWKDPNCGCCKSWVEHLRQHGFDVAFHDTNDVEAVKDRAHVPTNLRTCHTALVNGYVIEGHVPAADITRLLAEKPAIAGIGVAGMPAGSPGMEMGGRVDHYTVVAFTRAGAQRAFEIH